MTSSSTPTRAKVLDALLAGRKINCTHFAREIGVSDTTVNNIVQSVRDALHFRAVRSGMTLRTYYRARDEQHLRRARQAIETGGSAAPVFNFAPLLRTWQISLHDIALPRRIYRVPMDGVGLLGRRSV